MQKFKYILGIVSLSLLNIILFILWCFTFVISAIILNYYINISINYFILLILVILTLSIISKYIFKLIDIINDLILD